jgi:hypothetical protein
MLALACSVLLLAACGAEGGSETRAGGTETSTVDLGLCKGGVTAPVTVDELLKGLRADGYDVYVDPGCTNREASWQVSNVGVKVPEFDPEDYDAVVEREGGVTCRLFADAEGVGNRVKIKEYEGEDHVFLDVLNVSCDIKPAPDRRASQVEKLEAALNRLAAESA